MYKRVVISGGALKGFAILGALHKYEEKLKNIKYYRGVSVGSIIASLLCIGYTPLEILKSLEEYSFLFSISFSNIKNYGLLNKPKEILDKLFKEKLGFVPTIRDIFEITGKDIVIVATNEKTKKPEYFSKGNNVNIVDAILASCNIPFIFDKFEINGIHYLDGCLTDGLPVVDNDNVPTLCFVVYSNYKPNKSNNIFEYFYKSIIIPVDYIVELKIQNIQKYMKHISIIKVNIDDLNIYDDSKNNRLKLFECGMLNCS